MHKLTAHYFAIKILQNTKEINLWHFI